MTSEAVFRALLGVIILESLEEKQTKNKRGKTRQWIQRREEKGFYTNIVEELRVEDTKTYEEMLRMNYDTFKFILKEIEQDITSIALMSGGLKSISPGEPLTLTLLYLATDESHRSLSFQFRISQRTISYIIQEVFRAIINDNLSDIYLKIPDIPERWNNTAEQFSLRWNFSNAIGSIDEKHISKPAGGSSFYYNYKHTHSIVLMAVAGPDYECIYADV